jgi:anion-transporting  ArsA/GET3 family ATPase
MARELAENLRDPEITDLVIVSLPEEMPVNESIELHASAREKLGLTAEVIIVNMVRPSPVSGDGKRALEFLAAEIDENGNCGVARLVQGGEIGLGWNMQDRTYIDKLRSGIPDAEFVEVPFVFDSESDQDLIHRIAKHLSAQ